MDSFIYQKITYAFVILIITILSGIFPLRSIRKNSKEYTVSDYHQHHNHDHNHAHDGCHGTVSGPLASKEYAIGEALASGIFLGAGLIHMLSEAANDFIRLDYEYPFAFLLTGITFLILLLFEHIGREVNERSGNNNLLFVALTIFILSIHSLLEGIALGSRDDMTLIIAIFIAILAHKWADSYSLAVQIRKNYLSAKHCWLIFIIFAFMTPLGIFIGHVINTDLDQSNILAPVFTSFAAGTFLYIGTLHGLNKAIMVERCCNLKDYIYVIIGFSIMALVGIWA